VTVVMGLDQHRAQITAEWLGTETGEVSRARVRPADRDGVRRFLSRFADRQVEVALEAATGWRFVVEEIRAIGAQAHLAEPASALKGNKKRAKTDRADARHLRELLMAGRLPESYIAPAHLLDLRARVRLRATASSISAASGSSASTRSSITTDTRRRTGCSGARTAPGWNRSRCPTRHASRSRSRWR
jgi:transposase